MMTRVAELFDFTPGQLRAVMFLTITALAMSLYLLVRSAAEPTEQAAPLPVFLGDEEKYTGIFVLDPNTAPADSLELLPGVGRILADRIIEYRQTKKFQHEVDITEVKGIGPKLYERLKPYLRIRQ